MKTFSFTQEIIFNATPDQLYDLLMDEKKHAAFTGADAKISNRKGGKFSAYDNYITGKNLELIKGKKIAQEWHASEMPENYFSLITFEFILQSKNKTLLKFSHEKIPLGLNADYEKGWIDFYWDPMKKYLAAGY